LNPSIGFAEDVCSIPPTKHFLTSGTPLDE
jgi:hypothetical protein